LGKRGMGASKTVNEIAWGKEDRRKGYQKKREGKLVKNKVMVKRTKPITQARKDIEKREGILFD